MKPAIALLFLLITGCSNDPKTGGGSAVWCACFDNGDKPGYGFELKVRDGTVHGQFYAMQAGLPCNFTKADRIQTTTRLLEPNLLLFSVAPNRLVDLSGAQERTFRVRSHEDQVRPEVEATMEWDSTLSIPLSFRKM